MAGGTRRYMKHFFINMCILSELRLWHAEGLRLRRLAAKELAHFLAVVLLRCVEDLDRMSDFVIRNDRIVPPLVAGTADGGDGQRERRRTWTGLDCLA